MQAEILQVKKKFSFSNNTHIHMVNSGGQFSNDPSSVVEETIPNIKICRKAISPFASALIENNGSIIALSHHVPSLTHFRREFGSFQCPSPVANASLRAAFCGSILSILLR